MKKTIVIIGAGIAGLSAALQAAEQGCHIKLISSLPSERAQSVMAEGGINAALNTKDEDDSPLQHYEDTIKAACGLADPNAVWNMTQAAPDLVRWLHSIGVQFNMCDYDNIDLRNFGGQRKKRTAFSQSDTGKQIMTALIDAVRKEEASGIVERFCHHSFQTLILHENICWGCLIKDNYSGQTIRFISDAVIIATGGMHGLFGDTTGSLANTGEVSAELFRLGVPMANLEMIQFHPTTAELGGKRMLISEAEAMDLSNSIDEIFIAKELKHYEKKQLNGIMLETLGVLRNESLLQKGAREIRELEGNLPLLGLGILESALARKESRGAHMRTDYPQPNDQKFRKTTLARFKGNRIEISFESIPERR